MPRPLPRNPPPRARLHHARRMTHRHREPRLRPQHRIEPHTAHRRHRSRKHRAPLHRSHPPWPAVRATVHPGHRRRHRRCRVRAMVLPISSAASRQPRLRPTRHQQQGHPHQQAVHQQQRNRAPSPHTLIPPPPPNSRNRPRRPPLLLLRYECVTISLAGHKTTVIIRGNHL